MFMGVSSKQFNRYFPFLEEFRRYPLDPHNCPTNLIRSFWTLTEIRRSRARRRGFLGYSIFFSFNEKNNKGSQPRRTNPEE